MMETIISKNGRDYRMAVIFDKNADQYVLQFTSLRFNKGQAIPCTSFTDARSRFINNTRFYHGCIDVAGVPLNEEEFLGITPGLLGPNPFTKEVL
jgi:hypothetical protein